MIGTEHTDARSELGPTEGDHVLADMSSNDLTMLGRSIVQNPLDQVVAILIAGNVNQRDSSSVTAAFADTVEIAAEEVTTSNLETLLNNLRGELVGTVFGSIANDVVDGAAAVGRGTVLANMLNTPVPELTMSDNVDVGEDFLNAGTL